MSITLTDQQIALFEEGICPYCQKPLGKQSRGSELVYECQGCHQTLDLEELNLAWAVWEIDCDACGHHWVGVCPIKNRKFECPKCQFVTSKR